MKLRITLPDIATWCALDAVRHPASAHACIVWLVHASSSGLHAARSTFTAKDGRHVPLDRWVDILVQAARKDPGRHRLGDGDADCPLPGGFHAATVALPGVPLGIVALLPVSDVPVIEAALDTGDAIEMPWFGNPTNVGLGARSLPRDWSIVAALLAIAQQSARARLS